jgi:hypothetical protein
MRRLALAAFLLWGCTSEADASRVLRVSGYKNVQLTGYDWWGCGKGDTTCTGFTATAPNGERVKGSIGCGLTGCGKNCTVRL